MATEKPMITVVGCGPGGKGHITQAAIEAVVNAELVIGAKRLLEMFPDIDAAKMELEKSISDALDLIGDRLKTTNVTVLVSGDPGLFSLTGLIIKRFGRDQIKVVPGVSSVQAAFALLGLPWSSALTISAHKGEPEMSHNEILRHDPIAIITGWDGVSEWVGDLMSHENAKRRIVFVCENVTYSNEKVYRLRTEEIQQGTINRNSVIIIVSRSKME